MINRLDYTRRWLKNMTLAHFSIVLDSRTQKAVILWTNGSKWCDAPERYQAGTCELLRSGEMFTAEPAPELSLQSGLVQSSSQPTVRKQTERQPRDLQYVRRYLALIS